MKTITITCPHCGETAAELTQIESLSNVDNSSPLGQFLRERCTVDAHSRVPMTEFLETFRQWIRATLRIQAPSSKLIGMELRGLGVGASQSNGQRYYTGIRLH